MIQRIMVEFCNAKGFMILLLLMSNESLVYIKFLSKYVKMFFPDILTHQSLKCVPDIIWYGLCWPNGIMLLELITLINLTILNLYSSPYQRFLLLLLPHSLEPVCATWILEGLPAAPIKDFYPWPGLSLTTSGCQYEYMPLNQWNNNGINKRYIKKEWNIKGKEFCTTV